MNIFASCSTLRGLFLSSSWGLSLSKLSRAYNEPAVPKAFSFPVFVIGRRYIVLIPILESSFSLGIAFKKVPASSPSSGLIISSPFKSFAPNERILRAYITDLLLINKSLKSFL